MALTFEQLRTRGSTSRFMHEVIKLADSRDVVDVAEDLEQLFQAARLEVQRTYALNLRGAKYMTKGPDMV